MEKTGLTDQFARNNLPPKEQWPVLLLENNPDLSYAPRLNAATELLSVQIARGFGNNIALEWLAEDGTEKHITYSELEALSNQIAHVFVDDMHLVSGNRILLRGPNNLMMAASWLAALKVGLVTVPTMPLLRAVELKTIINKAEIAAAICDARLDVELNHCMDTQHPHYTSTLKNTLFFNDSSSQSLESLAKTKPTTFTPCDTAADDVCLIAFTSGTTGEPKGCMHFHRDVLIMCDTFSKHILRLSSEDKVCGTPPLAFTFGLGGLLCFPLRVGASAVLAERLDPKSLLEYVDRFKITMTFTAPTFYRQMAALVKDFSLASLRSTVSAGEALPPATRELWKKASGIEMIDGIGGTEMIHVYISSPPESVRPGAIGQVVPGFEAQVVDDNMQPVPNGTVGRLAVRGPTGCRYLSDERQKQFVQDGWNVPGDTFKMDDDGYLFYQARNDDMIISAGYSIAGPEVEDCLLQHPAVSECGVVGMPDETRGNILKAFIMLKEGYSPSDALIKELQDFVKQNAAPYKYPRAVEFVTSLPRTETGKIQRFVLREKALATANT